MQPDPYHAVPEEKRNINGFRILPSGALVTDTPPFDRLFEEGTGNGLYALARHVLDKEGAPFRTGVPVGYRQGIQPVSGSFF